MSTSPPGIEITGLTKSYGGIRAVRGIDLRVDAGQTVALLGPNGAGKSTTIEIVLGLTRPDAGTVQVFGLTPAEAIKVGSVGAMLQNASLIPDVTVRELLDVAYSIFPAATPVNEVLLSTGIGDFADQRTNKLSGGQKQRARFALALVSNPNLLVLDEPTVAMDVESRRAFWGAVHALAQEGRTIVFATHYLEEADTYADRIVLMARGEVVADGSPTELRGMVGSRRIKATLPDVPEAVLRALPGVEHAERRGQTVVLSCSDSDAAIKALVAAYPAASDLEISAAGLEQAFLELTSDRESAP